MTDYRLKSSDKPPYDFGWRNADTPLAAIGQVAKSYRFATTEEFAGAYEVLGELITIALNDKAREAVLHAQDRANDQAFYHISKGRSGNND